MIAVFIKLRIHNEPFEQWQLRETVEKPQAKYVRNCPEAWTITGAVSKLRDDGARLEVSTFPRLAENGLILSCLHPTGR